MKTKTYEKVDLIPEISKERLAFFQEQEKKGIMISTEHPSEEEIAYGAKWWHDHNSEQLIKEALKMAEKSRNHAK